MSVRVWAVVIFISLACGVGKIAWAEEPVQNVVPVAPVPVLNGNWSGRWASATTAHQGPMRASFTQIDACHYEVIFMGRFLKILPFRYRSELTVTATEPGRVWMSASKNLGPLLGTFTISAWATPTQFVAQYSSQNDHGQFTMSRVSQ